MITVISLIGLFKFNSFVNLATSVIFGFLSFFLFLFFIKEEVLLSIISELKLKLQSLKKNKLH